MKTVLVTGGSGFVLSNLVQHLLDSDRDCRVIALDMGAPDALTDAFFSQFQDRFHLVTGDVRDTAKLKAISDIHPISDIVHGATVTHNPAMERENPRHFIDVNLLGTLTVLDWARSLPDLQRFIYVSTGGVYGNPTRFSPKDIQPESGPFDPPELYAVSKYAAELVVRRYATLFGLDAVRVRLSGVFGPMERPTGARRPGSMSLIYKMTRCLIENRPMLVSPRSLGAGADFISAEESAKAFVLLLGARKLPFDVYNIAAGKLRTIADILAIFQNVSPDFRYELANGNQIDADFDPEQQLARNNAYDITRLNDLGWAQRSLKDQFAGYLAWVMADPDVRCPKIQG